MNRPVLALGVVVVVVAVLITIALSKSSPIDSAAFPCKAGSYVLDEWRYDYLIKAAGTRSERRVGRLFSGDEALIGSLGEIRETPLGRFAYFGSHVPGWNTGWLNTMTNDSPVFSKDGKVLPDLSGYFDAPVE